MIKANIPDPGRTYSPRTPQRRNRHKMVAACALLGAVALAVAGCSGTQTSKSQASGPVTITFASWDASEPQTAPATKTLIGQFEQQYPNIKVKIQPIPFANIGQKILLQVKAHTQPDVVQTAGNYTGKFVNAGALAPLDGFAGKSYTDPIPKAALNVGKYNGQLYAVPWGLQPTGFWYNKKVMAQAGITSVPSTTDELLTDLKQVKQKLPNVVPLGIDTTNRDFGLGVNWPWLETFNAVPLTGGKATADTPGMRKFLNFMRTIGQQKLTQVNQKIGYFRPLAAQNNLAFIIDEPTFQSIVQTTANTSNKQFNENWGVSTLPVGPSKKAFSDPQDHQLAIMEGSAHKQAAWTFIKWMTRSEAGLTEIVGPKAALPPISTGLPAKVSAAVKSSPALTTFQDKIVPTVVTPPLGANFSKAASPVMVGIQQAMTGTTSIDSIAQSMQSSLQQALKR